jgi:hypothetical protein
MTEHAQQCTVSGTPGEHERMLFWLLSWILYCYQDDMNGVVLALETLKICMCMTYGHGCSAFMPPALALEAMPRSLISNILTLVHQTILIRGIRWLLQDMLP